MHRDREQDKRVNSRISLHEHFYWTESGSKDQKCYVYRP